MFQVVLAYKWRVVAITGIAFVLSTIYFSMQPNFYTSELQFMIERVDQQGKPFNEVSIAAFQGEDDYYGTQVAILTSGQIQDAVQKELHVSGGVQARRLRGTRIVSITVQSGNPQTAADIANKTYEVYKTRNKQEDLFVPQQLLKLLPGGTEASEKDVEAALPSGITKKQYLESLRSVNDDLIINKLKNEKLDVESQLQQYSQRYKSKHPVVKELNEKLIYLNAQMEDRTKLILNGLRANAAGEFQISNMKLLQKAMPSHSPSGPDRSKGVMMSTLAGFVASIALILLLEYANQKIRTEDDLGLNFGAPFLGYVPLAKELTSIRKDDQAANIQQDSTILDVIHKHAELKDALVLLRTRFLFSMPLERSKRIMITSAIPGEGKSTVSALLAATLASKGEKVLLIIADIRRPLLAKSLGVSDQRKGLTDFLIGNVPHASDVIYDVPQSFMKLLPAGGNSPNPTELLESKRFPELLDSVSRDFDRVIIDVPPVLYIPDGFMIARHVHSSILVCGSDMVNKRVVKDLVKKFSDLNHPFIGIVINRAAFGTAAYYKHSKYYQAHKKYYSQQPEILAK